MEAQVILIDTQVDGGPQRSVSGGLRSRRQSHLSKKQTDESSVNLGTGFMQMGNPPKEARVPNKHKVLHKHRTGPGPLGPH